MKRYSPLLFVFFLLACKSKQTENVSQNTLFTLLPSAQTGVAFNNQLDYDQHFNIYTYRNFYNGGGVAIGDINNDGLQDVYMSSNMHHNKLYLNKGNFKFEDITEKVGVAGTRKWSTGVTMADVNGDGWLDIYVCNSGDRSGDNRENELFINNGASNKNGGWSESFTEKTAEYGLADKGYSTHAAFFDYDKDGDLDMYLLNNSFQPIGKFNLKNNLRNTRDSLGGHKLFRNDLDKIGHFTDVTAQAGILNSVIAFGLGVTVGDLNKDGWQDIYVSNDFFERDYLYLNQKNGTFKEDLENEMRHVSAASMGADMADINNDGYPDIFATDMLPNTQSRFKTKTTFDNWNNYYYNYVQNGYFHQFTRNMLQLNNGDNTFSEIGRYAGIEATDWSWGALIADFDYDGKKDIYVANGIFKDLTDQDYIQFISDDETKRAMVQRDNLDSGKLKVDFKKLIDAMPSVPLPNFMYANNDGIRFTDKAAAWGLAQPSFSNGAAYADLDNDGDLDLIVNNVNMEAFVYRNEATTQLKDNHWLQINLVGEGKNPFAIGTKLTAKAQGQLFYLEQMPMRGFESSVDYRPNFGLGKVQMLDSLIVEFPNDKAQILTNVKTNQTLTLKQSDATLTLPNITTNKKNIFTDISDKIAIDYKHEENRYSDFDRERLIYNMLSTQGPKIAKGDVNGDGREDFYICGAKDQAGKLFIQNINISFSSTNEKIFTQDALCEDTDAIFFDADGDHDLDLYVASGGSDSDAANNSLDDRLYINNGKGIFTKLENALPSGKPSATGCVRAADFDGDGDLDLFVGMRTIPGFYGVPLSAYLMENDGKGHFSNATSHRAPELRNIGMVCDAVWADYDNDKDLDLIIAGDWLPITIFKNENGIFNTKIVISNTYGWWNCIEAADLDKDGDIDFVLGNHGLNSRFRASEKEPLSMTVGDFDKNGAPEQIICQYLEGKSYPLMLRHDLLSQIPSLKKKYLKYESFANQTINDLFTPEQLKNAITYQTTYLASTIMLNQGNSNFTVNALPTEAQFSPIYAFQINDYDGDGNVDILACGNFFEAKPEVGNYDANYGLMLKGDGKGNFKTIMPKYSGFRVSGQVRDMQTMRVGKENLIFVAKNNDKLQVFR